MLLLPRRQVAELLDPDALVEAVATAMADLSAGRASVPSRIAAVRDRPQGLLAAMPAYVPAVDGLAAKLVCLFPENAALGISTHQALIAVFDPQPAPPSR